jgi:DNA-binding transcriptional MerR regulator
MTTAVVDEPLWTIQQLSDFLQVPVKSLRRWREEGNGPRGLRVGKHLRYRRGDVMQWLDGQ